MGLIQDLRAEGVTVVVDGDMQRGRVDDVFRVVFHPTRNTSSTEAQVATFMANDDFMGLIDRQGRFHIWRNGPTDPKHEDHPNRRRTANVAVIAANGNDERPKQIATRVTAGPIMRSSFGPPGPETKGS